LCTTIETGALPWGITFIEQALYDLSAAEALGVFVESNPSPFRAQATDLELGPHHETELLPIKEREHVVFREAPIQEENNRLEQIRLVQLIGCHSKGPFDAAQESLLKLVLSRTQRAFREGLGVKQHRPAAVLIVLFEGYGGIEHLEETTTGPIDDELSAPEPALLLQLHQASMKQGLGRKPLVFEQTSAGA
jgi:hypothetical protein